MPFRSLCLFLAVSIHTASGVFAAPPPREPVAVAYLSSIDGVLDDIDYIVSAGGQPQLSQMVQGFVANLNNLEGIDRTKPVGVYAFFPVDLGGGKKDPDIIGFIPVTDIEALKKTAHLSNVLSLEATDKPNRYEFKTPEKTFAVLIDQGHAFITENAQLLDNPLPAPMALTEVLGKQYDIVIQLRREGVPPFLIEMVKFGLLSESDKEMKKLKEKNQPEDLLKVRGIEMGRSALVTVMGEARSVWVGLRVSRETRTAVIDAKLAFTDSGKVAKALTQMVESPASLAKSAGADAPAAVHFHVAMPEEAKKLSAELGRLARQKKDPVASIPEPQRTSVNALIDVVQQTVNEGEYEVLLQFTGEPQTGMTLVAGVHVADGKKLSESVMKLLPEARNSDKVGAVTLDAGEARGVHFARIDGKADEEVHAADDKSAAEKPGEKAATGAKKETKVELFYGGQPSLYVGTEASTLWLVVGDGDALKDFASLAEEPARNTDRTAKAAFGKAHLHLSDWLGLLSLSQDQKTHDFSEAARVATKDPDRDAIRFVVQPVADGLSLSLTFDEAYLNLIGASIGKK